jgi:hypothetical protein
VWRAHFGQSTGSGGFGSASHSIEIPEPLELWSLLLLAFGQVDVREGRRTVHCRTIKKQVMPRNGSQMPG